MKVVLATMLLIVAVVYGSEKCKKQEDCGEDECCIYVPFSLFKGGDCEKLAEEGESCNVEGENQILKKYFRHCPCKSGMTCEPEEVHDMGIMGKIKLNERCVVGSSSAQPEVTEATTAEE